MVLEVNGYSLWIVKIGRQQSIQLFVSNILKENFHKFCESSEKV